MKIGRNQAVISALASSHGFSFEDEKSTSSLCSSYILLLLAQNKRYPLLGTKLHHRQDKGGVASWKKVKRNTVPFIMTAFDFSRSCNGFWNKKIIGKSTLSLSLVEWLGLSCRRTVVWSRTRGRCGLRTQPAPTTSPASPRLAACRPRRSSASREAGTPGSDTCWKRGPASSRGRFSGTWL